MHEKKRERKSAYVYIYYITFPSVGEENKKIIFIFRFR
ncbi:MAG: hypothetical protein ACI90V_000537 [Bacillariaceae sp.]|jgi:hypothetical protein